MTTGRLATTYCQWWQHFPAKKRHHQGFVHRAQFTILLCVPAPSEVSIRKLTTATTNTTFGHDCGTISMSISCQCTAESTKAHFGAGQGASECQRPAGGPGQVSSVAAAPRD